MYQVGDRVRVFMDQAWRPGIVIEPNKAYDKDHNCSIVEVYLGLEGIRTVRDDGENIKSSSPDQWSRDLFARFCRDIANGKVEFVDLTMYTLSDEWHCFFSDNQCCLNDDMAVAFATALRESTSVKTLWLKPQAIADLSLRGLDAIAQGIASCRTMEHVELFRLNKQSQIDILCSSFGSCPALKSLVFFECLQPSTAAFRELCKTTSVTKLQIEEVFCHYDSRRSPFKTELYRLSSLKSISLYRCTCAVVQSFLHGLVDHSSISKLSVTYMSKSVHTHRLLSALDDFLASRTARDSLISLEWGSNFSIAAGALVDTIAYHDALDTFDLGSQLLDAKDAMKVESLLKTTKNLRRLVLSKINEGPAAAEMSCCKILDGLRENGSLYELKIETTCPERVVAALADNKDTKLKSLSLRGGDPYAVHNFSQLEHLQDLRHLDISGVSGDIEIQSLVSSLKRNASLEQIEGLGYHDELIDFYLRLNRWCNGQGEEAPLKCPELFPQGGWPHLLSKASSNVKVLYCLLRWHPAIVEQSD